MKTAFLKSTAAAALVMLSLGAQADAVTLNFDGILASGATAPDPLGTLSVNGASFSFTGAYVWESRFSDTGDTSTEPIPADSNPGNGFIANRSRAENGLIIGMNLLPVANVTRYIKSVKFDLFVPADTPFVRGFSKNGTTPDLTATFSEGSGKAWVPALSVDFGEKSVVSRLEFGGTGMGTIGLDKMTIEFTAADIGGTVPEPASYALVALALLAAGGASRRRKA
ncbi:MAG: PEP-CTERM sorting domain-containing protein [Aquabacterium sp.]|nr:PEP-CTERM sorting domain-containing protein [Aquabacterium sp.]